MTIKVKKDTNPNRLAGAIAAEFTRVDRIELEMIGAAAMNQAVKGIAIASTFVPSATHELVMKPKFVDRVIDGEMNVDVRQTNPFVQEPTSEMTESISVTDLDTFAKLADLVARALQHSEPKREEMMAELKTLCAPAVKGDGVNE